MQKPKGPITCVCACILYKFILYSLYLAQVPAQAVSFRVRKKKKRKEGRREEGKEGRKKRKAIITC